MHARSCVIPPLRAIPSFHANADEAKGFDANARDHAQYRHVPKPHVKSREPFHPGMYMHAIVYETLYLFKSNTCGCQSFPCVITTARTWYELYEGKIVQCRFVIRLQFAKSKSSPDLLALRYDSNHNIICDYRIFSYFHHFVNTQKTSSISDSKAYMFIRAPE